MHCGVNLSAPIMSVKRHSKLPEDYKSVKKFDKLAMLT